MPGMAKRSMRVKTADEQKASGTSLRIGVEQVKPLVDQSMLRVRLGCLWVKPGIKLVKNNQTRSLSDDLKKLHRQSFYRQIALRQCFEWRQWATNFTAK